MFFQYLSVRHIPDPDDIKAADVADAYLFLRTNFKTQRHYFNCPVETVFYETSDM